MKPDEHGYFGGNIEATTGTAILNHNEEDVDVDHDGKPNVVGESRHASFLDGTGLHGSETSFGFFNPHGGEHHSSETSKHIGEAIDHYYDKHHEDGAAGNEFSMDSLPEYQYEKEEFDHHVPIHSYQGDGHQIKSAPFFQDFIHRPEEPIHHQQNNDLALHGPHVEVHHQGNINDHHGESFHGNGLAIENHHAAEGFGHEENHHEDIGHHFHNHHDPHSIHMHGPPHLHQPPPAAALQESSPLPGPTTQALVDNTKTDQKQLAKAVPQVNVGKQPQQEQNQEVTSKIQKVVNDVVETAIQNRLPTVQKPTQTVGNPPAPVVSTTTPVTPPAITQPPGILSPSPSTTDPLVETECLEEGPCHPLAPVASATTAVTPPAITQAPGIPSPSPSTTDPLTETECLESEPCQENPLITSGVTGDSSPKPQNPISTDQKVPLKEAVVPPSPPETSAGVETPKVEGEAPNPVGSNAPKTGEVEPAMKVKDPDTTTLNAVTESIPPSAGENGPNAPAATVKLGGSEPGVTAPDPGVEPSLPQENVAGTASATTLSDAGTDITDKINGGVAETTDTMKPVVTPTTSLAEADTDVTDKINGGADVTDTMKPVVTPTTSLAEADTDVTDKINGGADVTDTLKPVATPTTSLAEADTDVTDKINGGADVTDNVNGAASPTSTVSEAAIEVADKVDDAPSKSLSIVLLGPPRADLDMPQKL